MTDLRAMIEMLRYQYPHGVCTMAHCDCGKPSRGGGKCADCIACDMIAAGARRRRRRAETMSERKSDVRTMVCPFCGHTCETRHVGAVHCGPHGSGKNTTPAVRMVERGDDR